MIDLTDSAAFSDLVGAIYQCALTPENWSEVLSSIEAKIGAISSYLIIHDVSVRAREISFLIERNVDPQMGEDYREHYIGLNPLLPYLASTQTGEVFATRHLVTDPNYLKSEFYREWAQPQGWFDYAGVTLLRGRDSSAVIGFTRGSEGNAFDDEALGLLRLLAPHLTRVAEIGRLFLRERQATRDLASVLGVARFGVFVVDGALRLLYANPTAETLLERHDGIAYRNGVFSAGTATQALHAAVRAAAKNDAASAGRTIRIERGNARPPLILHVLPVAGDVREKVRPPPASEVIVLAVDPESGLGPAIAIFGDAYRLTTAERQVLTRLVAGDAPKEIADVLKIEVATVRTHLHRLFEKTGTRRQTELLTLLLQSTPPLRSG